MKKIYTTLLSSLILSGCLTSCAVLSGSSQSIKNANTAIDNAESGLKNGQNISNQKFATYSDLPYFGSSYIATRSSENLPTIFQNKVSINQTFSDLSQIAYTLHNLIKVPVYVDTAGETGKGNGGQIPITSINLKNGSIEELLDQIASKTDTSWSYKNGSVLLSQTETRTFLIKNLPGTININSSTSSQAGVEGSSSGSGGTGDSGGSSGQASASTTMQQGVSFSHKGDAWSKYEETIKSMLSSIGKVATNPNHQTVTITDKPSTMLKVGEYIDHQNNMLDKQVRVDVQVIAVDTSAEENYGLDWNAVFKSLQGGFTIGGQAATAGGSAQVFTPSMITQAFTFTPSADSSFAGSSLLINAMSATNRTSEITDTSATTSNSQPVPINFTQQISYLASVQTTVSGTTGAGAYQTSLSPGQLTVGFSMNILPVIEGKDNIRLQLSVNISNLKAMNTFSSGGSEGSTIQLPTVNNRNFMQKVKLKSGSTFVLTNFDDNIDKIFQNGVGSSSWWLFGGGYTAGKYKTRMILLVTPYIIEG